MTVTVVFTIMDLIDGMKTFVATVESGSFTAGAERLGISKKLASKYVAELEAHIGVRLLNRTTRSLSLTDLGQQYYSGCINLLTSLESLENDLRSDSNTLTGRLRIAVPLDFGRAVIVPIVDEFSRQNPDVTVEINMNDRFVDIVNEGYDLAIRAGVHQDSSLVSRLLGRMDIWLVGAPFLFEGKPLPIAPTDLNQFPTLQDLNFRAGDLWRFRKGRNVTKFAPKPSIQVNSALSIRDLAISGRGIACCPDLFVARDVEEGRLIRLLPDYKLQTSEVRVLFTSARQVQRKTRVFVDFLVQRFRCGESTESD